MVGSSEDLTGASGAEVRSPVEAVRRGEVDPLASIMRRHNQRLYRIARSILRDDAEAEDVVQDAFVKAFTEMETLREGDKMGAWLSKITVNMALTRLRQRKRREATLRPELEAGAIISGRGDAAGPADVAGPLTPERLAAMGDVRRLVEREVDRLSDGFREVFVLRVIEQMSVEETAELLGIPPETVKTRLHRAKAKLRAGLDDHLTAVSLTAFPFAGKRCERTRNTVIARLRGAVLHMPPDSHH